MIVLPAIVVSGPDGSGKSTLIDEIVRQLDSDAIPWRRVYVRPKRFDRLLRPETAASTPPADPHRHACQLAPITACAKAIWMALDAGTLWSDRWRAKQEGGVLLIERGIEDLAIDPIRYGLGRAPKWFLRGIVQLFSVADRVVLCVCSPDVAFARKGETDIAAMKAQYRNWVTMQRMPRFRAKVYEVNTERPVEAAVASQVVVGGIPGEVPM